MDRERVTSLLQEYEHTHPVCEYTWCGRRVWPFIRNCVAMQMFRAGALPTRQKPSLAWRVASLAKATAKAFSQVYAKPPGKLEPADVVILTHPNRTVKVGRERYQPIGGPLVDVFTSFGLSTAVWITGDRVSCDVPAVRPLGQPFERQVRSVIQALPKHEPVWLADVCSMGSTANVQLRPRNLAAAISRYVAETTVFRRMLCQVRCRLLLVDVWYCLPGVSAVQAASEVGILSADVQHGLQGHGHMAYCGWDVAPPGGFAGVPDTFWNWGRQDAEGIRRNNASWSEALVGGNGWLNIWRAGKKPELQRELDAAKALVREADKVVLVTLQQAVPWRDLVEQMVRRAPNGWLWLVRKHRGMRESPAEMESDLHAAGQRNVNVVQATEMPLYALMSVCDWHVTGFSTCAMEALAFGCPTVLVHPSGREAYRDFIEKDVMHFAPEAGKAADIMLSRPASPGECKATAERVFASHPAEREAAAMLWQSAERQLALRDTEQTSNAPRR